MLNSVLSLILTMLIIIVHNAYYKILQNDFHHMSKLIYTVCATFPIVCATFPIVCATFPIVCATFPIVCATFPIVCATFPIVCATFPIVCATFPIDNSQDYQH